MTSGSDLSFARVARRTLAHLLVALALLVGSLPLRAQQRFDAVIVIAPNGTRFSTGDKSASLLARGEPLVVTETRNEWLHATSRGVTGWIAKRDVAPVDAAVCSFTLAIERKPAAPDYIGRGNCWLQQAQLEKAITDFSEAIRIAPTLATAYCRR